MWESITPGSLGFRRWATRPTSTSRSTAGGWAARRRPSRSRSRSWSASPARRWSERAANYVFAGAGTEDTMRANREAFRRRRIVPRMLRDVAERDLSTTVLGTAMPAPLLLAPIGVQKVVHEEGELAHGPGGGGGRPADDRQHRLPLHDGGDRRGERRGRRAGSSSTGPTTPSCSRASSAAPRRPATARSSSPSTPSSPAGSRATCSRPGCPSSKAAATPTTSRTRSSAPASSRRRRRTWARRPAATSASSPTRR